MTARKIPFSINRNDVRPLFNQVVDGLREAIMSGYYVPGDRLPTSRELCPILGVSRIVTQAALEQLAAEGLVVSRPRVGTVVRDRGERRWLGHVLLVCPGGDENYVETVLASVLRDRLMTAGYRFTLINIPYVFPDKFDFSGLDVALAQTVDFIVAVSPRPKMIERLSKLKVPYMVFDEHRKAPPSAVGCMWVDLNLAMEDFAAACKAEGVKDVVQLQFWPSMGDATAAMRKIGLRVRKVRVKVDTSKDGLTLIGIKQAGMEAMAKLIAKRRPPRDAVFFVNDDYLASGALMAIAHAGLKAPEDIRIVTFANKRLGPVYPRELTRMEFDSRHAGERLSDAVLEYLKTGVWPSGIVAGPVWVAGETMRRSATTPPMSSAHIIGDTFPAAEEAAE
ncbi:MAG: GntR family transcriptional regulator [Kiritimatiellae bacterium]|nr:GntR family transcriptional regulator [Kiritimatiellia bacterium]